MKKFLKIFLLIIFFIFLTTYLPINSISSKSLIFPIQNIIFENNNTISTKELKKKLFFLQNQSLLFPNNKKIKEELKTLEFLKSFKIKKIFPNTLKIEISEKIPIAINILEKKKYYLFENGEKVLFSDLKQYSNLPLVIGKNEKFTNFLKNLNFIKFPTHEIESYHYFNIGRWDIHLKNDIVIKLPSDWYTESLKNFLLIKENNNFEKYKIFDYRIKDQLILN